MKNHRNEPGDYDDEIAAAFAPITTANTPDLWDRIETGAVVSEIPKPALWRNQPRLLVAAAAIAVVIGGAVAIGLVRPADRVDITDDITTTTAPPVSTTTTPTTERPLANLRDAVWVQIDLGAQAMVSNRGQSFDIGEVALGGRAVSRFSDGTVVLATLDGVFAYAPEGEVAEEIWPDGASELRRTSAGELIAFTDAGPVNLQTGQILETPPDPVGRIDAPNGFAVEVIPGEYETDGEGFVTRVIRPDAIRLLFDGEQHSIWQFGGPDEYVVVLDDFDGRYVLAHRRPEEPALPVSVHVVIDILEGTTESLAAIPGTVSLATPDIVDRPSVSSIGGLDLCPTMSSVIELTPPSELGVEATASFNETALAIARCDESWVRRVHIGEAMTEAFWEQLAASLRTAPRRLEDGWRFGEGSPMEVFITDGGDIDLTHNAGAFELRVVKFEDSIVLAGAVGPDTAQGLRSAAAA
ncbi:MAG: hypothetical protein KJO18_05535, partial [Acidimicrobiia bacterium]|nr:hypothetical protein [Acidimicrobiia bacterium]